MWNIGVCVCVCGSESIRLFVDEDFCVPVCREKHKIIPNWFNIAKKPYNTLYFTIETC